MSHIFRSQHPLRWSVQIGPCSATACIGKPRRANDTIWPCSTRALVRCERPRGRDRASLATRWHVSRDACRRVRAAAPTVQSAGRGRESAVSIIRRCTIHPATAEHDARRSRDDCMMAEVHRQAHHMIWWAKKGHPALLHGADVVGVRRLTAQVEGVISSRAAAPFCHRPSLSFSVLLLACRVLCRRLAVR